MRLISKIAITIVIISSFILLFIAINYNYVNLPYNKQANKLSRIEYLFLEKNDLVLVNNTSVYYGRNAYYITIAKQDNEQKVFVHDEYGEIITSTNYIENNLEKLTERYENGTVEYGYDNRKIILRVKIINSEQHEYYYYIYETLEQYQKYIFK